MQSALVDPRTTLLSTIDLAAIRVEFSDTPIVLLCGGPTKIKERPDDQDPPVASLRDAITRANTTYEVFRPEEITSWQSDGVYKNLMSFEADLASICSLVVIVLESAGSLVELGAFSQLAGLSKKIIAVMSQEFNDDNSFINLGVLRHIAENHDSSIKRYPWNIERPDSISQEVVDDVIADIEEELRILKKSEVLKASQPSHVMVLICELIRYFAALKESEILGYLDTIGASISRDDLRRKLFLLQEFKLIKKEPYSDSVFYMRSQEPYHRLRLGFKDGEKKEGSQDPLRIQLECIEYYNNHPGHRHRARALAQAQARGGSR